MSLRLGSTTEQGIEQAFTDGSILRTHMLRPTWHYVTPADIRWMLALTAPHVHSANAPMLRQVGLDRAMLERTKAVLIKALEHTKQQTRAELRQALELAGIATGDGLCLAYIMMNAELEGLICSGGRRGSSSPMRCSMNAPHTPEHYRARKLWWSFPGDIS